MRALWGSHRDVKRVEGFRGKGGFMVLGLVRGVYRSPKPSRILEQGEGFRAKATGSGLSSPRVLR